MIIYLLKFSACLAIFMVFYKLLLEKSSVHKFKRFYLLGALVLALLIPSLTIIEYIEPVIVEEFSSFVISDFDMTETIPEVIEVDYTPIILWSLYGLGVIVFLLKFCFNLNNIISRIKSNPKLKSEGFINVLVTNLKIPHTFFNYIFFNKYKFELGEIPKEVLLHEQTHAKQKHSIDVLILELLQIIFWFNPLIYLLKRDVKLNHEYLADQAVLQNGIEPSTYQTILLAFSSKAEHQELANAINYSSIKKRFTVMKTHSSKKSIWLKSILLLPLIAILFYSFTERDQVVKEITSPDIIELYLNENEELLFEDEVITFGEIEELFKENSKLKVSIKIYPDASLELKDNIFKDLRAIGIKKINICTSQVADFVEETQQIEKDEYYKNASFRILDSNGNLNATKSYAELTSEEKELLMPQATVPNKRSPQQSDLNRWKNSKQYGVWFDGKRINNSLLDTYPPSIFSLFYESKLEKNAVNYGKHYYQVSLYSNDYYEEKYKNGVQPLSSNAIITIKKSNTQERATSKELAEYNQLAKKYNEQPKGKQIIKRKDLERLEYLYSIMSDSQKENAQPFPNFPPPPPPPAPPSSKHTHKYQHMWILLNNRGQFLVDDELSTLSSIETYFRAIANDKSKSKEIVFKYDENAPEDIIKELHLLIEKYNLKNIYDTLPPPPPPPVAPTKKGNGPNGSDYYPIPPAIPQNATPEQRVKMQATIDEFEEKYKRKVHQIKSDSGVTYNVIVDDQEYDPSQQKGNEVKTGFLKINNEAHYFVSINNHTKYYNRQGFEVSKSGSKISKNQINASNIVPGQYITKVYSNGKIVAEFFDNKPKTHKDIVDIPPPPAPKSSLDFVIDLAKKNAIFFFENKKITSDEAIQLIKNNKELNLQATKTDSKQPQVFISKAPINLNRGKSKTPVIVNGKTSKDNQYILSSKKMQKLALTLKEAHVISFKIKFQGKPTQSVKGNELNKTVKNLVKKAKEGTQVQLYDIKDNDGYTHPPVIITITDKLVGVMGKKN
ncbi:M56 family metallopeptidase [Psychroserpens luteus]|uniref:M56 family metallopeptidase n=1 Tax=Psychroserpens luteus TaxID=1434066 RepID=A0ABW5ZVI8_9FLAO|nr:M56 family metallopeptidase [Psychroserpens luteus]